MTGRLGNLFRRKTAVQTGRRNPVLLAAVDKSSKIYDEIPLREFIGEDTRSVLSRELYLELNEICNAFDPVATCREKLAAMMLMFAAYQVLMIPPAPEDDPSGLRSQPGITGQLKEHLVRIAEANEELRSKLYGKTDEVTFDDVWRFVQRSYWKSFWYLETFNAVRIELGDCDKEHDWFMSFKHAACANQEHIYRREADLPPTFGEDIANVAPTAYSIFTDIVLSGADDPELEWRDYHRDLNIPAPHFETGSS